MGGVAACKVGDGKGSRINGCSGTNRYVFLSLFLSRNVVEASFSLDRQDEVQSYLFHDYVSNFRHLLQRLEASLTGFTISPSFSQSLQVLKPVPSIPRHVVGSGSGTGVQEASSKNEDASDEDTDTSSDVADIEGLLEMDWDSD